MRLKPLTLGSCSLSLFDSLIYPNTWNPHVGQTQGARCTTLPVLRAITEYDVKDNRVGDDCSPTNGP